MNIRTLWPILGVGLSATIEGCAPADFSGARPPVIFITVDTLRKDHLSCYGYPVPTSPELDNFAADAVTFKRHYTAIPYTLPSHCTLLTGLYPRTHEVLANGWTLGDSYTTIAQVFKEHDYPTAAFVGSAVLHATTGIDRGFDHYDDNFDLERTCAETNKRLFRWIARQRGPFFLWVHYWDPHDPYAAPPPYDRKFGPNETGYAEKIRIVTERYRTTIGEPPPKTMKRFAKRLPAYDNEIAYTDQCIGAFLEELRRVGAYDNSVIGITADHGEAFGEHDLWGHGMTLFEEEAAIPFLLKLPAGERAGTTHTGATSSLQLPPTILHAAGITAPPGMEGAPIDLDGANPHFVTAERRRFTEPPLRTGFPPCEGDSIPGAMVAIWSADDKLIRSEGCPDQFFDLANDPKEQSHRTDGISSAQLDSLFVAWIARQKPVESIASQQLDEETERKMRALGYLN